MTLGAGNRLARIGQFAVAHPWRVVTVFVVIAATARFLASLAHPVPWIFGDEFIYIDSARTFAEEGRFAVRDQPFYLSLVTVLLDAPGFLIFGDTESAYVWIKAVNSLVMASAAFPAFGLARMVLSTRMALGFAALVLAWPSNAYVLVVMTEPAFFPALLLAVWAIARAIEHPTRWRQAAAMGAVLLCLGVRLQALLLLLVIPAAVALAASIHRGSLRERLGRMRPIWPLLAFCVALPLAAFLVQLIRGSSLSGLAGGYSSNDAGRIELGETLTWIAHHAGVIAISVLIVPAALALGVFGRLLRRGGSAAEVAVLATIASLVPLLLVQVASYASAYSNRIVERNLFAIEPLLVLVALMAFGAFGHERIVTVVGGVVLGVVALTVPVDRLLSPPPYSDTFTLLVVDRLAELAAMSPQTMVRLLVAVGLIGTAVVIVRPPRRVAPVFVGALLLVTGWAGYQTNRLLIQYSRDTANFIQPATYDWIDRSVGADAQVGLLWPADDIQTWVWQQEIWNRSVRSVVAIDGAFEGVDSPLRTLSGRISRATGEYQPATTSDVPREQLVVAPARWQLEGTELATASTPAIGALRLWRLEGPLRIRFLVAGVYADGWGGTRSEFVSYGCRGGTFQALIRRGVGASQDLEIRASGQPTRILTLDGPPRGRRIRIEALPETAGGACRVTLTPLQTATGDELVGNGDPRVLGVHIVSPTFVAATKGSN